jgi:carbonic anhydrase
MKNHRWETRHTMTPQKALQFLQQGNERFVNNIRANRDMLALVNETQDQQFPFTAILSCSDSRTSTELIFDQGLGDIFSIRLAGNIASMNAIASMEYACMVLGTKLIVVLGHTSCGAIKGACDRAEMGNLPILLEHIYPAVSMETETHENRTSQNTAFVQRVAINNVRHQLEMIWEKSILLKTMLDEGKIGVVGAMYDLKTGLVAFGELVAFDELVTPEAPSQTLSLS